MNPNLCDAEIRRRAARYLQNKSLLVDFYRIRQKLSIPLPLSAYPKNLSSVREFPVYPFAIWVFWELEERILSLGYAGENLEASAARAAALRDLEGLTRWKFAAEDLPGLWSSHLVRILVTALGWKWPEDTLRMAIMRTLGQLTEYISAMGNLPKTPPNKIQFANIPIITSIGWAVAATIANHPDARIAVEDAREKIMVWLDQGVAGHGEGVCYDGYVADFLMDFVHHCVPATEQERFLGHQRVRNILEDLFELGAPDCPENIALIGDVEPVEMPFHYSFAIKFIQERSGKMPFRIPCQFPPLIRCDALSKVRENLGSSPRVPIDLSGPKDAHYAVVWDLDVEPASAKAVVSWSNSCMGHLHCDAGHFVLAVGAHWIITDPGYQQYLPTTERSFTLGASAHNQPVINGCQAASKPESREYQQSGGECIFDLTATYPVEAGVRAVRRIIRPERNVVVVRDEIETDAAASLVYCWHANPGAFLRVENGQGLILLDQQEVRVQCENSPFVPGDICRLPGSRGSLTFKKFLTYSDPSEMVVVTWRFEIVGKEKNFESPQV